ncbi:MAG: glycosyltransferase [Nitrospiraceae bacterium]|nr:glycosyltransferase [Nitrospiraceae bacterium]
MSEQHDQETISIILCSMDRHADLEQAVASVRRSGPIGSTAEIVVVEEADEPKPVDGTRYVHLPRAGRGFGYARNVGVKTATGELLLFLDDDCRAERGWAEALIQPFAADGDVLGVAGSVAVQGCGPVGYAENILGFPGGGLRYLHESGGQVVPTRHLSTCNCAYRRRALEQVGGFPEEAQAGSEDALAAERVARLGSCRYQPNAVVYHRTRDRFDRVLRWFMRRGFSEMASMARRVEWRCFSSYLLRSSWTLRAVGLLLLGSVVPPAFMALPVVVALYYGAMLWRFRFARRYPSHRSAWWLVPAVKFTMDIGNELGRWRFVLSRGQA